MTRTLTFTAGTGVLTESQRSEARTITLGRLSRTFGGCSLTSGTGSWIDPKGNLLTESIDVYTVHLVETAHTEVFWRYCTSDIAEVYRQECIAVTRYTTTEFELIGVNYNASLQVA